MRHAPRLDFAIRAAMLALVLLLLANPTQTAAAADTAAATDAAATQPVAVQARRAGTDRRAHRALPGRPAGADVHGLDLSARDRAGRALVQGASGRQGRRRCEGDGEADLGRSREIAGRVSGRAEDDEREARLDAEARRCLPRAAEGRHGMPCSACGSRPRMRAT